MSQLYDVAAPADQRLRQLRLQVVRGTELATLLAGELDQLADRCDAPATARASWLALGVSDVAAAAWAVVVRDGQGVARGALVLLDQVDGAKAVVTLASCTDGHAGAVLAESPEAAALLGYGFARTLRQRRGAVWAVLGPLREDAAWLADFVSTVPGGELVPTVGIPVVRRGASSSAADYLGPSMRRTLRKAANRAQTDGVAMSVAFTMDPVTIDALLPALEQLHRDRDHHQGRHSELDDPVRLAIWRSRLTALAAERRLEVATLHIAGELAAQVVGIVEPTTYRVVEGVLATRFSRYAPGRVLETALLQRVLDDPAFESLDWMTSVASETLLAANDRQPVSFVHAGYPGIEAGRQYPSIPIPQARRPF